MKSLRVFAIALVKLLILSNYSYGQNIFDPYKDYTGYSIGSVVPPHQSATQGFEGEMQVFLKNFYWEPNLSGIGYDLSYKIELVSFPFVPDCPTNVCGNPTAKTRNLVIPPSSSYSPGSGWSIMLNSDPYQVSQKYEGPYPGQSDHTHPSTLISRVFCGGTPASARVFYPHSVLRYTFYVSHLGEKIDSISFTIDHTRGMMRYYPFKSDNDVSAELEHDIAILPYMEFPASTYWPLSSSNVHNTINYFPPVPSSTLHDMLYPTPQDMLGSPVPAESYFHPTSYSLLGFILGDMDGDLLAGYTTSPNDGTLTPLNSDPLTKHRYTIDQPIDLTAINFAEKVIYNPLEVELTNNITLTFPSGYTFQTVHGRYPTTTEVDAAETGKIYADEREVPVSSQLTLTDDPNTSIDERISYYYIQPGCTLRIEPCVTINDAKIILMGSGAVLEYDPNATYGNFYPPDNTTYGGTINTYNSSPSKACKPVCTDASYFDFLGESMSNDVTDWTTSNIDQVFPTSTNGVVKIGAPYYIFSGSTVTIGEGLRFEFGESGKIIVEEGAKLVVNGTADNPVVFTSACQGMWPGIEVWGSRYLTQAVESNQGVVELNHATIENAYIGVYAGKRQSDQHGGGIIRAENCSFINNEIGVKFSPHRSFTPSSMSWPLVQPLNNRSHFTSCVFETNDYLYDYGARGHAPVAMAYLEDVRNVAFINSTFQNAAVDASNQPLFPAHLRGTGIYAADAGLQLHDNCIIPGPVQGSCAVSSANTFKGLSEGVWALATSPINYIGIKGNNFDSNIHGIVLEGNTFPTVLHNTFKIPASTQNPLYTHDPITRGYNKPVGLYLLGSTYFTAEENIFNGPSVASTTLDCSDCSYGMVVNNSATNTGLGTGLGYRNEFFNTSIGLQAEADNGGGSPNAHPGSGFSARCNQFTGMELYDFTVAGKSIPYVIPGKLRDQGICNDQTTPAANLFHDQCTSGSEEEIYVEGSSIAYNQIMYREHNNIVPTCITQPGAVTITVGCATVFDPVNFEGSCPSNLPQDNQNISVWQTEIVTVDNTINALITSLDQLIDGGSTSALLSTVQTGTASQAEADLVKYSPYLSDEVMIAALARADLSNSVLRDVVISNSPVTAPVMDAVTSRGFTSDEMREIDASQSGISARYEKYAEIDHYQHQKINKVAGMVRDGQEQARLDSVVVIMEADTSFEGRHRLLPLLLEVKEYAAASRVITELGHLEGDNRCEHCAVSTVYLELVADSLDWNDIDSTKLAKLNGLISTYGETAYNARAALKLAGMPHSYSRDPYGIGTGSGNRKSEKPVVSIEESRFALAAYPNPFSGRTTVKAVLPVNCGPAEVQLRTLLGQKVGTYPVKQGENTITLQASSLPSGIYFLTLITEKGIVDNIKLIITD